MMMRRHGVNEVEYTEIRPLRPNQSVVLAGLGVRGTRVGCWSKTRDYRSTQGAGDNNGLVQHRIPSARRPRTQQGWPDAKQDRQDAYYVEDMYTPGARMAISGRRQMSAAPRVQLRDQLSEAYSATPVSAVATPVNGRGSVAATPNSGRGSVQGTYDMMFDRHLKNIVGVDNGNGNPGGFRDQGCQTPANDMRLSPQISSAVEEERRRSQGGGNWEEEDRWESEYRQEEEKYRNMEEDNYREDFDYRRRRQEYGYIKEEDEEEEEEDDKREHEMMSPEESDDVSIIGELMVRDCLEEAAAGIKKDQVEDFTDVCSEISSRDLRVDDFSDMDYYRAGLDPTDTYRDSLLKHGDGLKDSFVNTREMEEMQRNLRGYTHEEMEEMNSREMMENLERAREMENGSDKEEDQTYCVRESVSRESSERGDSLQDDLKLEEDLDRVSLEEDVVPIEMNSRNMRNFKSKIPRIQIESRH